MQKPIRLIVPFRQLVHHTQLFEQLKAVKDIGEEEAENWVREFRIQGDAEVRIMPSCDRYVFQIDVKKDSKNGTYFTIQDHKEDS